MGTSRPTQPTASAAKAAGSLRAKDRTQRKPKARPGHRKRDTSAQSAKLILAGECALTRPQQKLIKQCSDPICYSLGLKNLKHTDVERGFKQLKQTWFVAEARKLAIAIPVDERGLRTAQRLKKLGIFTELYSGRDLFGADHAHLRFSRAGATFLLRMLKSEERTRPARQTPLPFLEHLQ